MVESVQTTAEEINVSNVGLFVVIVAGHLRYCLSMETIEKTSIDQSFEVCFSFRFFFFLFFFYCSAVDRRKRVAVVGGGISGAGAAFALSKAGFHVTLFERQAFTRECKAALSILISLHAGASWRQCKHVCISNSRWARSSMRAFCSCVATASLSPL